MKQRLVLNAFFIAGLVLSMSAQDHSDPRNSMIQNVQNLPAMKLDKKLPDIRLQEWLQSLVGVNVEIHWVMRYVPAEDREGPAPEFPDCVEADATLQDGRSFFVMVVPEQRAKPAYFRSGALIKNKRTHGDMNRLSDLPRLLRETNS